MAVTVLGNGLKSGKFSDCEKDEVIRALTAVLDDPSAKVRGTLSALLVDIEGAPYHLVHQLSRDHMEVAKPLLAGYSGIRETDLVDLVGQGMDWICQIIAMRRNLQVSVSAAIAEIGGRESCALLLENETAQIAGLSLARLAERFGSDPHLRTALIARDDLPPGTRHDLLSELSQALGNLIISRNWLTPERSRLAVRDACEKATMDYAGQQMDIEQRALVAHLAGAGKLTPGILIRALVIGNITFVAESLAFLSGVPVKRTYRLMKDPHGAGLDALLTKAGLPGPVQTGFSIAIDCVISSQKEGLDFTRIRDRRRLVERIITRHEEYSGNELDYLFSLLMRLASEVAREDARDSFGWGSRKAA